MRGLGPVQLIIIMLSRPEVFRNKFALTNRKSLRPTANQAINLICLTFSGGHCGPGYLHVNCLQIVYLLSLDFIIVLQWEI